MRWRGGICWRLEQGLGVDRCRSHNQVYRLRRQGFVWRVKGGWWWGGKGWGGRWGEHGVAGRHRMTVVFHQIVKVTPCQVTARLRQLNQLPALLHKVSVGDPSSRQLSAHLLHLDVLGLWRVDERLWVVALQHAAATPLLARRGWIHVYAKRLHLLLILLKTNNLLDKDWKSCRQNLTRWDLQKVAK